MGRTRGSKANGRTPPASELVPVSPADRNTIGHSTRSTASAVAILVQSFLTVSLLSGAIFGYARLRADVDQSGIGRLSIAQVGMPPQPAYLRVDPIGMALAELGWHEFIPIGQPDVLSLAARQITASPWVQSLSLTKLRGKLVINAEYRQPVLCVPLEGRGCYVAADAMVLPPDEVAPSALRDCLFLDGVGRLPVPAVGREFDDHRVRQAARLAYLLRDVKAPIGLTAIVARSGADVPLECELTTKQSSRLYWGKAPTSLEPSDEAFGEQKVRLARLEGFVQTEQQLEQANRSVWWDLTDPAMTGPIPRR